MVKKMKKTFVQAYRQAPWRIQTQWMGIILLGLVLVAMVTAVYLNITARAATTGRQVQSLESDQEQLERDIADLNTHLAVLTSSSTMEQRAKEMGFVAADTEHVTYAIIPGYTGRSPALLAPPPGADMLSAPLVKPNYTQSLWDLLFKGFLSTSPKDQATQ